MASSLTLLETAVQKCASSPTASHLRQLHALLLTSGHFLPSPFPSPLRVKLLDLSPYPLSLSILRSVPLPSTNDFNSLLRSLSSSPHPSLSLPVFLSLLRRRRRARHCRPDALSLSFALKACARLSDLPLSRQLHSQVHALGFSPDTILMTTLVDAYAKSGRLDSAHQVFDEMRRKDIATWNVLLSGLSLGGEARLALSLFRRLIDGDRLSNEPFPNEVTVIAALSAAAQLGSVADGESIRSFAKQSGLESDARVKNALIDMYSKCGSVSGAVEVFGSIPDRERSVVSYNAVLLALALHGRGAQAVELFDGMAGTSKVEADQVTYLAVLCGCTHAGLVEEGLRIFRSMRASPTLKHYGCVVDLLGRAGRLREAYNVVRDITPLEPDAVLWQTLLGACKTHGDVELAEVVSRKLLELGSNVDGDYVLLSNVYAAKERWSDVGRVRTEMRQNDIRKVPGFSYTEINGEVHTFFNGDRGHRRRREIYRVLDEMVARIRGLGYVPETRHVLHDVVEEDKEVAVGHHSEKLAIACAMVVGVAEGEAVRVIKNLTICGDCHTAAKLISKAYGRVIVVRDRARFHRFEAGDCSCDDYW